MSSHQRHWLRLLFSYSFFSSRFGFSDGHHLCFLLYSVCLSPGPELWFSFAKSSELLELLVAGQDLWKKHFFHQLPRGRDTSPGSHPAPASWICQDGHSFRLFRKPFLSFHLNSSPLNNRAPSWKNSLSYHDLQQHHLGPPLQTVRSSGRLWVRCTSSKRRHWKGSEDCYAGSAYVFSVGCRVSLAYLAHLQMSTL